NLVWSQEAYGGHVDVDRTLYPPSTSLKHPAPVLEAVIKKLVGRHNGGCGIPVLDGHRRERDVQHIAIGTDLRHLDPVAHPHEVVVRQLYACNEGEQGVAEDEQDYRHHGAESAHEEPG